MYETLVMIAAPILLCGVALILLSLSMRNASAPPVASTNPKHWVPLWKMRRWFSPRGFKLHMTGWVLFFIGDLAMLIYWIR